MAYQSRVRSDPAPAKALSGRPDRTPLVMPRLRGWYAGWADPMMPREPYNRLRAMAKTLALAGWGWRGADDWASELPFEEGSYGFYQQRIRPRHRTDLVRDGRWAQAEQGILATGLPSPPQRDAQWHRVRQALALRGADLASPVIAWLGWFPPDDPRLALIHAMGVPRLSLEEDPLIQMETLYSEARGTLKL